MASFWRTTPRELRYLAEGAQWRIRREDERAAWMLSYLLQPYQAKGAEPIRPQDLLHPPIDQTEDAVDLLVAKQTALQAAGRLMQDV